MFFFQVVRIQRPVFIGPNATFTNDLFPRSRQYLDKPTETFVQTTTKNFDVFLALRNGIALGQLFNYNINVYRNTMYLTFRTTDASKTVTYEIDLSNNVDAYGNVDEKDNPKGYSGDAMYFKAGAYNQCSTRDEPGMWYTACAGTGCGPSTLPIELRGL